MKKWILFLLVIVMIFMTACSSGNQQAQRAEASAKTSNTVVKENGAYHPVITADTPNPNPLYIANMLFTKYLEHFKGADIPTHERLKDFTIHSVQFYQGKADGFVCMISYSVECVGKDTTSWTTGNGTRVQDGRIDGKVNFVTVKKEGNSYRFEGMTVSP